MIRSVLDPDNDIKLLCQHHGKHPNPENMPFTVFGQSNSSNKGQEEYLAHRFGGIYEEIFAPHGNYFKAATPAIKATLLKWIS